MRDLLPSLDGLAPRAVSLLPLAMAEGWALAAKRLPGQQAVWQEFQNRVQAFTFFRHADPYWRGDLSRSLHSTNELAPWRRLWTWEGLGWLAAEHLESTPLGRDGLPSATLACVHPGLGMQLASRTLRAPAALPSFDEPFEQLLDAARRHSHPGWAEVTFEASGLVLGLRADGDARLLHRADRDLHRLAPHLVPYLWHGYGRGLYFSPFHALPYVGSVEQALARAQRDAPHPLARLNALSGLAWALTLVNLRQPAILERALPTTLSNLTPNPTANRDAATAWSHGVHSALHLWQRANGRDDLLHALLRHAGDARWRHWGLSSAAPALRQDVPAPELFRYLP